MHDAGDMELLRDYDRQGSEAAFAALVERHVNLVYSAALRHVGIASHAEEITQAVFIILARKAASLRTHTILEGWLYETTRLTALSFQRGERRRQFREQEAYMQSTLQETTDTSTWNQLAPLLDEAMTRLGKKDRDAVMLRFFKDKSLREVAAALRMTETAAQRRVHRAVEKLRTFFTKRGVILPAAVLTAAISANSVQAAPVALAKTVTAVAFVKGSIAAASTLTLVKGTLTFMRLAKLKTATIFGLAILTIFGTTAAIIAADSTNSPSLKTQQENISASFQSSVDYLKKLHDDGKLPGIAKNEHGAITFGNFFTEAAALKIALIPEAYPLTRTFDFTKNGQRHAQYHYTIRKESKKDGWQLIKAWRTDDNGKIVEEYAGS
jgi:RNA polymerase sigma factor (sigma-70 family)